MQSTTLGALVIAAAGLAACGDPAGPGPEPVGIIGTYALRTVDGHTVPHRVPTGVPGRSVEIVSGEARMGARGVCTIGFVARMVTLVGTSPPEDIEYDCTYTVDDPSARETDVTIRVEGAAEPATGTYRDGRLAFTFPDGQPLVFER